MSDWKQCNWKNVQGICGENERISVTILPEFGGKLASLHYKPLDFELTAPNGKDSYNIPYLDADFSKYDASGLDDAFPNINANRINDQGRELVYPDHGEIWSSPFCYDIRNDSLVMTYRSKRFPYRYHKEISLQEEGVVLHYKIINTQQEAFPCIWTFHGLFRYEEDMELMFPKNIKKFINVIESPESGGKEQSCSSIAIPPRKSNTMVKYYAKGSVATGSCGFYYPKHRMECILDYDPVKLPFLGVWITAGGYRGDYNCALEPSNGFYDDIEIARENGCLYYLEPNKPLEFTLKIQLNEVTN